MPLYEYVCRSCSRPFEELVRAGETPCCPACGATDPERVLSVVAVGRSDSSAPRIPNPCDTCGDPRKGGSCPLV